MGWVHFIQDMDCRDGGVKGQGENRYNIYHSLVIWGVNGKEVRPCVGVPAIKIG